jgi:hypothetical protein
VARDSRLAGRIPMKHSKATLFLLLILFTNLAHAGFLKGKSYPIPATPAAVASGDLNNDGHPDLVIGSGFGMIVLLGKGDGAFQRPIILPVTFGVYFLTLADLNGDGILDLVTSGGGAPANLAVFLGKGNGRFQNPVFYNVPNTNVVEATVGDLNGDGKIDIVASILETQSGPDGFAVLLGHGDGTFGAASTYVGGAPEQLVLADFNKDGHLDVAGSDIAADVALGKGDGTLGPTKMYAANGPGPILAVDVNRDGNLDLVTSGTGDNQITVELGNGDGTFNAPSFTYMTRNRIGPLAAADFTGDGIPDLVYASAGIAQPLTGVGDGTFVVDGPPLPVAQLPTGAVAADFNGDGHMDFAVVNQQSQNLVVYLNDGK